MRGEGGGVRWFWRRDKVAEYSKYVPGVGSGRIIVHPYSHSSSLPFVLIRVNSRLKIQNEVALACGGQARGSGYGK